MAKPNFNAQEAEDGTWMVVDIATAHPVVIDGYPQVGMAAEDATDLAEALSKIQGEANGTESEAGMAVGGTADTEPTASNSDSARLEDDKLQ